MPRTKRKPRNGVRWEAPPESDRPDWAAVARELRAHPGEWMLVFEHGRASWVTAVQIGHVSAVHKRLGFETRTADNTRDTPRTCTLYMRFNPDLVDDIAELVHSTEGQK